MIQIGAILRSNLEEEFRRRKHCIVLFCIVLVVVVVVMVVVMVIQVELVWVELWMSGILICEKDIYLWNVCYCCCSDSVPKIWILETARILRSTLEVLCMKGSYFLYRELLGQRSRDLRNQTVHTMIAVQTVEIIGEPHLFSFLEYDLMWYLTPDGDPPRVVRSDDSCTYQK